MTDTEIINGLQALMEEQLRDNLMSFDFGMGRMWFTIKQPIVYVPSSPASLQTGQMPDLRALLAAHMQPHLVRLVTRKIIDA